MAVSRYRWIVRRWLAVWALCWLGVGSAWADSAQFPRPPELEPDIRFWERVYSKVTTQGGLLHDDRHLDIVYEELAFPSDASAAERAARLEARRNQIQSILRRWAAGPIDAPTEEEARIRALFPEDASPAVFEEAIEHVRFQLGQADRFREGLIRSGTWERHVQETLRQQGLPEELSVLPHVESSFNPKAYSKVGAAGLWQFMKSTGSQWLHIDTSVDERLDPYKSTVAAAQLLAGNYTMLGTWPLALTAYNHGAAGMRRAKEQLGTDDIVTIVRNYQGKTFGFASRNFYVSFLAALEIDRHADQYFGHLERRSPPPTQTVRVGSRASIAALAKTFGTDRETLHELNLSLLDPVWSGRRLVPRGFDLRIPATNRRPVFAALGSGAAAASLPASVPARVVHRVRVGETLPKIARQYGVELSALKAFNPKITALRVGATVRIPATTPDPHARATVVSQSSPVDAPGPPTPDRGAAAEAYRVKRGDTLYAIARQYGVSRAQLIQANHLSDDPVLREGQTLSIVRTPSMASEAAP